FSCVFCVFVFFFFFSSRRRHTRCYRDWSSDVCSSDLIGFGAAATASLIAFVVRESRTANPLVPLGIFRSRDVSGANLVLLLIFEIGRASGRGRGEMWGEGGLWEKKEVACVCRG